ncbi:hypothetical protein VNO77_02690 [Canavalia gladiata]|uniref:Uncharacterized protein n=1 Tax=Canavalia gladiata TaxID=3824 RepID=A0AAN9R6B6_CANGL
MSESSRCTVRGRTLMLSSTASSIQLHRIIRVFLARPRGEFESEQGRAAVVTNASNTLRRDWKLMLGALNFAHVHHFCPSPLVQLWMLTILIWFPYSQPVDIQRSYNFINEMRNFIRDSVLTWTERAIERELDASGVQSVRR